MLNEDSEVLHPVCSPSVRDAAVHVNANHFGQDAFVSPADSCGLTADQSFQPLDAVESPFSIRMYL